MTMKIRAVGPLLAFTAPTARAWTETYEAPLAVRGEPGEDDDHFNWPRGLATDPDGNLYVCDG
jgi:hypothetical protein